MIRIPPEYLEQILNDYKIKYKHYPRKHTYQVYNPFIPRDSDYHMGLNYNLQVYHCFKTDDKGSLFDFIVRVTNKPEYTIIKEVGDEDYTPIVKEEKKKANVIATVPKSPNWSQVNGIGSEIEKMHFRYLISRNISEEKILRNKFYYSKEDLFRTIIPYFIHDSLVYWVSRDVTGKAKKKYMYPNEEECKNKSGDVIYNFNFCDKKQLIVCEGQLNSLIVDGIAIGGTNLSSQQLKFILAINPKKVIVALDQDKPGKTAIIGALKSLHPYIKDLWYLDYPELTKEDFADMGEVKAKEFIEKYQKRYTRDNVFDSEVKTIFK